MLLRDGNAQRSLARHTTVDVMLTVLVDLYG